MSLVLYQMKASPPCRAVIIVAKLTGLVLELKVVNVLTKDQMKPEFLKMNQAHTIPTLVDDTFVLWESRAIMRYLVDMYAPNHPLYPKDIKKRALIDQLLDFDLGTLYKDISTYFYSYLLKGQPKDNQKEEAMKASFRTFESILGDKSQRYLVGKEKSLADISIMVSLSVPEVVKYDMSPFPKVKAWYEWIQRELSAVNQVNREGIAEFRAALGMS
ncbi:glutathione S-transferase D7-like [Ixodes scapularis]|uniref:glutathione S-transferase D7-like n=1 Tax=Ixodes scapularis TaxID=6945 RepID=UPI001C387F2B|nr:glutathione S-transferase D7-like [Ixodes scapularis]